MRISDWSSDVCSSDLANDTHQMKMLAAIKEKIGRNLFTNFLPERAHYSQAMQEHVPVWRFDKDVRTSLPPMRAFLEEAMTRIGSHQLQISPALMISARKRLLLTPLASSFPTPS